MRRPKTLDDIDLEQLDSGIRETVRKLRSHGFNTTDSGDGKTKGEDGRPVPHVVIVVQHEHAVLETRRVEMYLRRWGLNPVPRPPSDDLLGDRDVVVELSYNPAEPVAVIVIDHIHDGMLSDD